MRHDLEQLLEEPGTLVAATRISTNVYDAKAATNLGATGHNQVFRHVSAKAGTTPTLATLFIGADNAALDSNPITIWTFTSLSDPTVPVREAVRIPTHAPKRFFGFSHTLGGSSSPSFTVRGGINLDNPIGDPENIGAGV